jgi:hypothetical protein
VVLSLRRLSKTTINTVNDDFHKVKKSVFGKKTGVSAQAEARPGGPERPGYPAF